MYIEIGVKLFINVIIIDTHLLNNINLRDDAK